MTMSLKTQAVTLSSSSANNERLVKRGARGFFRLVREVASYAEAAPAAVIQAAADVRSAWEESSRPNV
jgi:ribosome-associated toxin RatA of RatAB toxin-antitoxin module